jgi:heptosyltransferase II
VTHQVEVYLALVRALGLPTGAPTPRVHVTDDQLARADDLLRSIGLDGRGRIVGIQLGSASGPARQWATARFAELAEILRREESVDVVLLGSRREEPLAEWIHSHVKASLGSLVGKDTPDLVAAIRARCRVLVSADTGPAHLAAAVGTPVVTLFGPTDPRKTQPIGKRHIVLSAGAPCSPCFFSHCPIDHICMTGISVDQVRAAVVASLAQAGPANARSGAGAAAPVPTRAANRGPRAPGS